MNAEEDIKDFLRCYRSTFPSASILPKMHILEDHTIPWFRRHHVGAGLMGEQGAESVHAHMMHLDKRFDGIPDDVDRLKYLFKGQMLESAPSLTQLRPIPKKRKLKDKDGKESESETDVSTHVSDH